MLRPCATLALLVFASLGLPAPQPARTDLRAGASKVDITPAPDAALPMSGYANRTAGFKSIHDDLNVRAIVVDDGASQAALVGSVVIGISAALWE